MSLEDLLARHEGKTLEFKRDLSSPDRILRTVVAFGNTSGGDLVIGVEDATRTVVGVDDPLETADRLANLIADRIVPAILPDIEVVPWRSTNVIVASIADSALRPHHLRDEGREQGVFVRVGATTRRASADLIDELRRYASRRPFDEEPRPDLDERSIDLDAVARIFATVHKVEGSSDLRSLRILTDYQGKLVPTVGGILLFGRERLHEFPDAWIKIGAFAGTDRVDVVDTKDVQGYLPDAIQEAGEIVARSTRTALEIDSTANVPRPEYPPVAVREAITNAVCHADYSQRGTPITVSLFSDRIEIENPGILPFGLTLEDVLEGASKLRNHVIGSVFYRLRLIEQFGSGINRMRQACRDMGLADPVLEERSDRFRVTLFSGSTGEEMLDPKDAAMIAHLRAGRESGGLSTSEVARAVGLSERSTRTRLGRLADRGFIRRIAMSQNDPRARWIAAQVDPIGTALETDTALPIRPSKRKGDWLIVHEAAEPLSDGSGPSISIAIRNEAAGTARISRVEVTDPIGVSRGHDFPGTSASQASAVYPTGFLPRPDRLVDGTYSVRWFALLDGRQIQILDAKFGLQDGVVAA